MIKQSKTEDMREAKSGSIGVTQRTVGQNSVHPKQNSVSTSGMDFELLSASVLYWLAVMLTIQQRILFYFMSSCLKINL